MLRLLNAGRQVMPPVTIYKDLKIERVLDFDDRTLSFSIPISKMPADMILENYIQTQEDEYVIKQISLNGNYYDIVAQLNIDELEGTHWETFTTTEQTVQQTANLALAGTGWTCTCNVSKKRSIKKTNVYTWDILKQIVKTYRVEMLINSLNKSITFVEKRGEDKGVYFSSQLNLKSVGKQAQTTDFYTIIIPIGKDGLTIEPVNNGKKYLENYTYSNKKKTYYWKDERYTVAQNLKEDAEAKLADLATPRVAYTCNVIDLAKANDYSFLRYDLGDTVTIIDSYTNIKVKQRIVKVIEYPDNPEKNECELSNTKLTFEELTQKYEDTADTVDNITTDNGTVDGNTIDSIPASKILQLDEVIANSAKFKQVDTDILNVKDTLTATTARIGTLETTALTATTADIKYAKIETLNATTAKISALEANALTANSAEIKSLKAGVADINTLMFGTASGGSLSTEFSNSVVGLIGDAQIKSAMIKDISADKILSGKLYTNLVQICSKSGNLDIADNTIQIKDGNKKVRVQIGKDGTGDYNIYIWDKNGKLMFDPLYGVQADGIKKAIIRNDMISDTANISGEKIDIASLITNINKDGSTTLKASKIFVDVDKQTLDVSFKNLTTSVTTSVTTAITTANTANTTASNAVTTANSAKSTATTANTTANTAKNTADTAKQTANTANSNASNALSKANTLETNLKTVTEKVTTQGTQLTAIQGNISSKIWQQDITTAVTSLEIGGRNLAATTNKGTQNWDWNMQTGGYTKNEIVENGIRTCKLTRDNVAMSGWSVISFCDIGRALWQPNTYYTLAVDVKASVATQMNPGFKEHNGKNTLIDTVKVVNNKTTAGKWVRLIWVVKSLATLPTATSQITYFTGMNSNVGVSYQFKNLKLEQGTKATDWTPAPEDIDSSLATLEGSTTTLSNKYTTLDQTLNSLKATVNSNVTAITKKADGSTVTSLQSNVTNLTATVNSLSATVSSNTSKISKKADGSTVTSLQSNVTNLTATVSSLSATVSSNTSKINKKADGSTVTNLQSNVTNLTATVNSLSATVNSNTTAINKKADGSTVTTLQNKVTTIQTDLSGYKTTVANTYATKSTLNNYATTTAVNSAIDQKASSITQTVSATYSTKADLNNLQIGGTNLLKGTNFIKTDGISGNQGSGVSCTVTTQTDSASCSGNSLKIARTDTTTTNGGRYWSCNTLTNGQKYTWSFWAKGSGTWNVGQEQGGTTAITLTGSYKKYTKTFTANSSQYHQFIFYTTTKNATITLYGLKLEQGDKATAWTPATEDMATKASLELKIDKTDNNKIVSMLNASADEIKLTANRLSWSSTGTSMTKDGNFTCKTGQIGGFKVTSTGINASNNKVGMNASASGGWAFHAGNAVANTDRYVFCVGHEGDVYAQNATISGTINATAGSVGGYKITNSYLMADTLFSDNFVRRVFIQKPTSDASWVYSIQKGNTTGTSPGTLSPLFNITAAGELYQVGGAGIGAWLDFRRFNTNNTFINCGSIYCNEGTTNNFWVRANVANLNLYSQQGRVNIAANSGIHINSVMHTYNNLKAGIAQFGEGQSYTLYLSGGTKTANIDCNINDTVVSQINLGYHSTSIPYLNSTSDLKCKNILKNMDIDAIKLIMSLRPIEYYRTDLNDNMLRFGFGAQEVFRACNSAGIYQQLRVCQAFNKVDGKMLNKQQVLSMTDKDIDWKMSYEELIAPLVYTVQQLYKQVEQLKQQR